MIVPTKKLEFGFLNSRISTRQKRLLMRIVSSVSFLSEKD